MARRQHPTSTPKEPEWWKPVLLSAVLTVLVTAGTFVGQAVYERYRASQSRAAAPSTAVVPATTTPQPSTPVANSTTAAENSVPTVKADQPDTPIMPSADEQREAQARIHGFRRVLDSATVAAAALKRDEYTQQYRDLFTQMNLNCREVLAALRSLGIIQPPSSQLPHRQSIMLAMPGGGTFSYTSNVAIPMDELNALYQDKDLVDLLHCQSSRSAACVQIRRRVDALTRLAESHPFDGKWIAAANQFSLYALREPAVKYARWLNGVSGSFTGLIAAAGLG